MLLQAERALEIRYNLKIETASDYIYQAKLL